MIEGRDTFYRRVLADLELGEPLYSPYFSFERNFPPGVGNPRRRMRCVLKIGRLSCIGKQRSKLGREIVSATHDALLPVRCGRRWRQRTGCLGLVVLAFIHIRRHQRLADLTAWNPNCPGRVLYSIQEETMEKVALLCVILVVLSLCAEFAGPQNHG
jgi:hypothetical protein